MSGAGVSRQFGMAVLEHLATHPQPVSDCSVCSYLTAKPTPVRRAALYSRRSHWGLLGSDVTICGIRHFDTSLYELDGECGNCLRLMEARA